MAVSPYSWAAQVGEQGQIDKQNADQYYQNTLMQMFQEEAMRERQQMGAQLDMQNAAARLAMQQPYDIASENRALANDMALRRFYAENPIPRASEEETVAGAGNGQVYERDGQKYVMINGTEFPV